MPGKVAISNTVIASLETWLMIDKTEFKARRGSGFDEIFCIFANMSCLCIHLVTLFNLPCKKNLSWNFFFMS